MGNQPWPQFQNGIRERSITLGAADEKPEGRGQKASPLNDYTFFSFHNNICIKKPANRFCKNVQAPADCLTDPYCGSLAGDFFKGGIYCCAAGEEKKLRGGRSWGMKASIVSKRCH